jgi:hypothetical protein
LGSLQGAAQDSVERYVSRLPDLGTSFGLFAPTSCKRRIKMPFVNTRIVAKRTPMAQEEDCNIATHLLFSIDY